MDEMEEEKYGCDVGIHQCDIVANVYPLCCLLNQCRCFLLDVSVLLQDISALFSLVGKQSMLW